MPQRINGAAFAHENLSRNLQYYTAYACSSYAYSDPDNAECINIRVTGDYSDVSQKNFEVLLQSIGLRAMPVIMTNPIAVADLSVRSNEDVAAPTLSGEGFVWKFAVELENVFENNGPNGSIGPVGFLIDELHGVILPSGAILSTNGQTKNIEFTRKELL
jgi:hypothetical protein